MKLRKIFDMLKRNETLFSTHNKHILDPQKKKRKKIFNKKQKKTKKRFSAHNNSFKNSNKQNSYVNVCFEEKLNPNPKLKWEILKVVSPYKPGQTKYELCLLEKVQIGSQPRDINCLNKRSDNYLRKETRFVFRN